MKHAKRRILVAAALAGGLFVGSTAPTQAAGEQVYIITAVETKGESAVAIPDTADGAQFAIDEINKAGGVTIKGKKTKIKYERIPVGSTAALAETAARQIVDKRPTAVFGFIATAHNPGAAPVMKASGIPTIFGNTGATLAIGASGSVGAPNLFRIRPTQSALAAEQFKFMVSQYAKLNNGKKLSKIGMICVQGAFGKAGCDVYGFLANQQQISVVKREENGLTATDLSAQVTAICSSGAEAIMSVNYPNPAAAFMNEMVNRGCKLPIVEGASGDIAVMSGAFTPPADFKLYAAVDCHPAASAKGTPGKKFADAFAKKYNYPAGYSAGEAYDGIYLLKAAIETANSTKPADILKAMKTQKYKGVCYDKYSPVASATGVVSNILVNKSSMVSYVGKTPKIESTVVLPK
ncbi:MAG: ABC transporter substrate-binding protein [Ilumatobacteraceae bacterium]|nr:ABC transporter substrate-binding protein [Ilumatobacteraceae bacterium]